MAIPEVFARKRVGTTIAIAGFQVSANWEYKIIEAVLENFFHAILFDKLVVKVGKHLVSHATLGKWVASLESGFVKGYVKNSSTNVAHYYKALV